MVRPGQRRRAVEHLKSRCISERRACRLVGFSRSAAWRPLKGRDDGRLRARLKALAERYPRYGYPTLHAMLRAEGQVINRKRTYRIYREEGLQVRTKKRKKLTRPRVPMILPAGANERWSVDFMSDQLASGRRFRILNLVDDYTRECVLQIVDFSISGQRLARELDQLGLSRPLPRTIVCDNGPELTCKAMFFWARETGIRLHFIQPGKPTQNAFVESFNGKFRDYCLNLHWFASLEDARSTIEAWRCHYNEVRPHRSLGKRPPAVFAQEAA
jgi:putative transposase